MAKRGKKGRYDRSPSNVRYRSEQRWIKNKMRKMNKTMKKHPNDMQTLKCLEEYIKKYPLIKYQT